MEGGEDREARKVCVIQPCTVMIIFQNRFIVMIGRKNVAAVFSYHDDYRFSALQSATQQCSNARVAWCGSVYPLHCS